MNDIKKVSNIHQNKHERIRGVNIPERHAYIENTGAYFCSLHIKQTLILIFLYHVLSPEEDTDVFNAIKGC